MQKERVIDGHSLERALCRPKSHTKVNFTGGHLSSSRLHTYSTPTTNYIELQSSTTAITSLEALSYVAHTNDHDSHNLRSRLRHGRCAATSSPTASLTMEARAFWDQAHKPTPTSSSVSASSSCTPFTLPSNGIIEFNSTVDGLTSVTLDADAHFYPNCTGAIAPDVTVIDDNVSSMDTEQRDPFYASSLPVIYALASTTVTAYMLVILLCITPRSFVSGGTVVLGSRGGFTGGSSVRETGVGIGGRPLLQKVAAISVAISLSIATANTFNIAEEQYNSGYMDAVKLQKDVLGSRELKVIMVISDTFLWLAQAQTLIRLFPRHREKVIIKWTALALITLSVIFSILDDFVYAGYTRPAAFVDAIPALSYLFQIALSLLYSAWVIYYALTKRQYAFYHPRMRNMCLVALISILSILVPVVFFVVDISMPDVASWG
ncbi:hypothetical protein V490_04375, partial [Pseudogymnoascus sp. VKM F-3557]